MENRMVRKSNSLIEASYRLSTVEQKLILFLVGTIKKADEDFQSYQIRLKDFQNLMGGSCVHYNRIEDMILGLKGKNMKIIYPNNTGKKVTLNISWLSSSEYIEGSGVINLCFDPKLKPFLLQLKSRFTNYHIKNIVQLKSQFSIRIYELLKQYEKVGQRILYVSDLRESLGIEPTQYKLYSDFKRKVILVAQEELAKKTDISFDYEEIKIGRGVGKIRFIITSQLLPVLADQNMLPQFPEEFEEQQDPNLTHLLNLVPEIFQSKQSIRKVVQNAFKQHGFDYVMRNIIYSNDKSNALKPGTSNEKGSNYRVYLAKAIKDDYGLAYYEDLLVKKEAEQLKQKTFVDAEKHKQQELNRIDQERENREKARIFITSYAPETMQAFEEEAKKRMSSESLARYLRKDPIGNFEFKRRLEDIVMEHTGIRKPQLEAASESPENKPAGPEKEAAAE
ncbi:MAG: hypothetical protein CVV64_18370 [Candidatus Wallbacteria bacterium HGW-Wallbacteria-1]|jgi:plasmid replication initiation protein|uniref:Initiator Rep protein WH1 domain-containing protein n=1 Tax=Candidatus Wallbacteria bacterium HGW-Wallbacteria-1 TaxID=2013854 RepID=A0A2N1PJM1_9BACT|nr:MAG: hypothetical protein CVV64_18370 [Candidatus Wallbacteria bacterium HGW-Wallbacteria-1]